MNYYNENDPKAAAWLRELIKEGHISNGVVDERSIVDVQPNDLHEYNQCHFFAGIGGWSYALRLAGIPDDEPVWTGSCPCQPFSVAGKQLGTADARHLWPVFFNLIAQRKPAKVFGEQVASKDGRTWLDGVFADLESVAYAVAGADLCAAGLGAPHIRQRLYWVAHTNNPERRADSSRRDDIDRRETEWNESNGYAGKCGSILRVAHTDGRQCGNGELQRSGQHGQQQENSIADRLEHATSNGREQRGTEPSGGSIASGCSVGGLGDSDQPRSQGRDERRNGSHQRTPWSSSVALPCTDGKTRRIEPGTFPLAHGVSGRVGLLRGYGNAIVPQVAAAFIAAFYEACDDVRSDVLMSDPMF